MALTSFTAGEAAYQMQFFVQRAVSEYAHDTYTSARKLSGTAIVGADASINVDVEDFIGQLRWYKTLNPVINVATTGNNPAAGDTTTVSTAFAKYVKTVRTHGARQVNVQSVVSKEDGLAKIGRDFGETKAQDEHNSILETLNGIAAYEATRGGGIVNFTTDASYGNSTGFFVDICAAGEFGAATAGTGRKLIDASQAGASKGERLFRALGMAFKDYESDFYYMITSPELLADLRTANLVDQTIVTEGNLEFQTIFNGKFRLIQSRASTVDASASANVNDDATKTTFIVKPNALTMKALSVPMPVEIDRAASAYMGGGTTDIWYRWGYVVHPMGYNWAGAEDAFVPTSDPTPASGAYDANDSWARADINYLNLGILPIFHA